MDTEYIEAQGTTTDSPTIVILSHGTTGVRNGDANGEGT